MLVLAILYFNILHFEVIVDFLSKKGALNKPNGDNTLILGT